MFSLILLPTAWTGQTELLEQVVKGIDQMPLKHWQAWGIEHISKNPVLVSW